MVECVHHYDLDQGKNYYYYNNPQTGKFQVHPWDVDQTWSNMMFGNGSEPFKTRVLDMHAEFRLEYQNRLREVLDLLFDVEPMRKLIEEFAAVIRPVVEADRRRWDYAPEMLDTRYVVSYKAGIGKFYEMAPQSGFEGMVELMKNWVVTRRKWITDELLSDEHEIPRTPSLSIWCQGARGCTPLCNLVQLYSPDLELPSRVERKHSGETIVGSQWRVALDSGYEIEGAVWLSQIDMRMVAIVDVPGQLMNPKAKYRARVRTVDSAGRWSHWSDPLRFRCESQTADQLGAVQTRTISPLPVAVSTQAPIPNSTGATVHPAMYRGASPRLQLEGESGRPPGWLDPSTIPTISGVVSAIVACSLLLLFWWVRRKNQQRKADAVISIEAGVAHENGVKADLPIHTATLLVGWEHEASTVGWPVPGGSPMAFSWNVAIPDEDDNEDDQDALENDLEVQSVPRTSITPRQYEYVPPNGPCNLDTHTGKALLETPSCMRVLDSELAIDYTDWSPNPNPLGGRNARSWRRRKDTSVCPEPAHEARHATPPP